MADLRSFRSFRSLVVLLIVPYIVLEEYNNGNNERTTSLCKYSGYKTVKNNSSNIKDSGYRSVADLTAAKYLRRTYTNFGHQYNHHTGGKRFNFEGEGYGNNEKSESSDFVVLFIRVLVFFVSVIFVSGLGLFTSQCVAANNFFVSGNSYSSCIFIYGRQNKEM